MTDDRNLARVRAILRLEWDPIGTRAMGGPSDECDTYADRAYVMLMDEGATAEEIADYLFTIAAEHMGLGTRAEYRARHFELSVKVAKRLVGLRPEFEIR